VSVEAPAFRRGPRRVPTDRGRRYDVDGELLWSVTAILKAYPKEGLAGWAARGVAEAVVADWAHLEAWHADGDELAIVDHLKGAPWRGLNRSAALGSSVHEAAEAYVLGRPMPPWPAAVAPYMAALERFLADHEPEYLAAEATVVNRSQWYAGTLDAIVTLDGVPWLIDYKTGEKGPYETDALQLAAYRNAEEIYRLPDGTNEPMLEVAGAAVVKLRPDGYTLYAMRADDEVYRAFLYVREVYRFTLGLGDYRSPDFVVQAWPPSDEVLHRQLARSLDPGPIPTVTT